MAFLFRMTFNGLCAFVQRQTAAGEPSQGTVLLPEARTPVEDLNVHLELRRHDPQIHFRGMARPLRGKQVSVVAAGATPSELQLVWAGIPSGQTVPTINTDEDRDAHWIADMGALGAGGVANDCFGALPNARVAARVKLSFGTLATSRIIEDVNGNDQEWAFRRSFTATPTLIRAMASEFSLTALVPGTSATVRLVDTSTGGVDEFQLEPIGSEVVIDITNLCTCDDGTGPIEDFSWFYRLAANPAAIVLPYPNGGGGISDTYCPPARYPAHPQA